MAIRHNRPSMALNCFLPVGRSSERAVARVRLAEELGYDTCYVTHINGHDSLTLLTWYAANTHRIKVGPGVVPLYSRTPATMAQSIATLDELSGGRAVLGLGVSHRPIVEGWHGQTIDHPVAEMREYVAIVRAILHGEDPPAGTKWQTAFKLGAGLSARPGVPIQVAGLSPNMLRLAGEIADGVLLWLCTDAYIRDVVVPAVREGRERAGKTLEGFEILPSVPCAVVEDPAEAHRALRRDLVPYLQMPFYRQMIANSGYGEDIAAFDAAPNLFAKQQAISERFLNSLAAIGDPAAVRAGLGRYRAAGATVPSVAPIARLDAEATLRGAVGA
jgi:alkanesulfonate monooxygenase SsuD/methylene tetrahydromethanopterin reductase-like flavin-dependent oxidoreductase (luciferase family)